MRRRVKVTSRAKRGFGLGDIADQIDAAAKITRQSALGESGGQRPSVILRQKPDDNLMDGKNAPAPFAALFSDFRGRTVAPLR